MPNVVSIQRDLLTPDPTIKPNYNFISCLHVLEHIGLGRYGDKINPDGPFLALSNILAYACFNANVLLAVPVGSEATEFNSQRIFSAPHFVSICYSLGLRLQSFSLIDDDRSFVPNIDVNAASGMNKATGLFHFIYSP